MGMLGWAHLVGAGGHHGKTHVRRGIAPLMGTPNSNSGGVRGAERCAGGGSVWQRVQEVAAWHTAVARVGRCIRDVHTLTHH